MEPTALDGSTIVRDVRVDRIGFVDELKKHFAEDLRDEVKATLLEKEVARAEGEYFEALMVAGGEVGTIDPKQFYRLLKSEKITEKDFLACISVKRTAAEEFLAGKEIDRISSFKPATPQLRVTRKKDAELSLVDAVKGIAAAIGG